MRESGTLRRGAGPPCTAWWLSCIRWRLSLETRSRHPFQARAVPRTDRATADDRGQCVTHCSNSLMPPKRSPLPPACLLGIRHRELVLFVEAHGEAPLSPASVTAGGSNSERVLTCRHMPKGNVGNGVKDLKGWLSFVLSQYVHEDSRVNAPGGDFD